jgi:hypothetical protein
VSDYKLLRRILFRGVGAVCRRHINSNALSFYSVPSLFL